MRPRKPLRRRSSCRAFEPSSWLAATTTTAPPRRRSRSTPSVACAATASACCQGAYSSAQRLRQRRKPGTTLWTLSWRRPIHRHRIPLAQSSSSRAVRPAFPRQPLLFASLSTRGAVLADTRFDNLAHGPRGTETDRALRSYRYVAVSASSSSSFHSSEMRAQACTLPVSAPPAPPSDLCAQAQRRRRHADPALCG